MCECVYIYMCVVYICINVCICMQSDLCFSSFSDMDIFLSEIKLTHLLLFVYIDMYTSGKYLFTA